MHILILSHFVLKITSRLHARRTMPSLPQSKSCTNPEVVLKYAKWVLKKDETMGIRIFMEQMSREAQPPEELHPSRVLEYVQEFPTATLLYLEYIIVNKSVEVRITLNPIDRYN